MAKVETIVFLSLVLDLFAFTIPLPLFPRLIEWYTVRETSDPNGFLSRTLAFVSYVRSLLYSQPGVQSKRWDIVLLGGLMGSVFSTLQFIVSPKIGALSDKYGRKRVLLLTMVGNILSALIWIQSSSFASYMLSRIVGGLSEGNVQLAIAILSDVTTPETRSKALAFVGIAFSICFCIGPPIGAYFASRPLPGSMSNLLGIQFNIYAVPALITLVLLVVETIFLALFLPETRKFSSSQTSQPTTDVKSESKPTKTTKAKPIADRLKTLTSLRHLHFSFLALFSGIEFTLTFLTFDLLDWSNTQNGKLIGSIGIMSALLQGGYVRKSMSRIGEAKMAQRGVAACALGLVLLAIMPQYVTSSPKLALRLLQLAAGCMAITSATVVTALTANASLQCSEETAEHPDLAKGKALGQFRSAGQLGRALGPLLACASYWTFGPSTTYATSAIAMALLTARMKTLK